MSSHKTHWILASLGAGFLSFAVHAQGSGAPGSGLGQMGTPLVGLIANTEKTAISPIQGVPGASTVGAPIALPAGVSRVYLAPLQRWAVVEQGRTVGVLPWNGVAPGSVAPVPGAMEAPDLVSFSPSGESAILVSLRNAAIQALTGLPGAAQAGAQLNVSSLGVIAAAISDDGTLSVVLTASGNVYLVPASGPPTLIFHAGTPAGLSFLPGQPVVAIADGAAATVTLIGGLNSQSFTSMAIAGPRLAGTAALLQSSMDGQSLILSANGGQTAYRIDLASQSVSSLDVPAAISRLDRVSGDLFLFSANPGEAAWLLLEDGSSLRAGFAPSTQPFSRAAQRGDLGAVDGNSLRGTGK